MAKITQKGKKELAKPRSGGHTYRSVDDTSWKEDLAKMAEQTHTNQQSEVSAANNAANLAGTPEGAGDTAVVRRKILHEATRLFSAKGYNGVSVREIVEAAGVTKPTLYYYFPSKEQLFKRIIIDLLEDFRGQLEQEVAQPGTIRERLLRICEVHFEFARRNAEQCRLAYSVYFSSERNVIDFDFNAYYMRNFEKIGEVIADGIASNELRAGNPMLMAFNFIGVVNLYIMGMLYSPDDVTVDGLAERIVDLTLGGMARPGAEGHGGPQ